METVTMSGTENGKKRKPGDKLTMSRSYRLMKWLEGVTQKQIDENRWSVKKITEVVNGELGEKFTVPQVKIKLPLFGLRCRLRGGDTDNARKAKANHRERLIAKIDRLQSTVELLKTTLDAMVSR